MVEYTEIEDGLIRTLRGVHARSDGRPNWKLIVDHMNGVSHEMEFKRYTVGMIRNRYQRLCKAFEKKRLGLAKNHCHCGELAIGHTCRVAKKIEPANFEMVCIKMRSLPYYKKYDIELDPVYLEFEELLGPLVDPIDVDMSLD